MANSRAALTLIQNSNATPLVSGGGLGAAPYSLRSPRWQSYCDLDFIGGRFQRQQRDDWKAKVEQLEQRIQELTDIIIKRSEE